jgi:hypothetical protein
MVTTITLIGDSVLDNFYWLNEKKNDLTQQLTTIGYKVNNFAVDESRLQDVINGITPQEVYQKMRHYPYPTNENGKVIPLKLLNESDTNTTVISVGGNDIRVNLLKFLISNPSTVLDSIFNKTYIEEFEKLVSDVISHSSKVIIVCVYVPYLGSGSNYESLKSLKDIVYERLRTIYKAIGIKFNVPILDLSRTFNYCDRTHYGTTEIEPSNISSQCIANCIHHINTNYRGYGMYYAPNCDIANIQIDSAII